MSVKQSSVVRMGMSKQHNNLRGSNYVPQHWPGDGGPTLLQTAGAAHHLTADSYGRCDPNLPRLGRPSAGSQSQSQQTSKPLTQEESENNMEEVVETRLTDGRLISQEFDSPADCLSSLCK